MNLIPDSPEKRKEIGSVLLFTAVEVIGIVVWFYLFATQDTVYTTTSVLASGSLFVALTLESITSGYGLGMDSTPVSHAAMMAMAEVIIWNQWFIIVSTGMWSAQGIGPALVYIAILLTVLHSTELNQLLGRHPLEVLYRQEAIGTAIVEAVGATLLWIAFREGYLLIGIVALAVALTIEHFSRAAALPMLADRLDIDRT